MFLFWRIAIDSKFEISIDLLFAMPIDSALAHLHSGFGSKARRFSWSLVEKELHSLVKRGMGKGGARHTKKPRTEIGLLLKCFNSHISLVKDLGVYENISRNQACHPEGLFRCLPLVKGIVELEPTCEVHTGDLRAAVFQLVIHSPAVNETKFKGEIWTGIKVERLTTLLHHMRRLKSDDMRVCAAKLTGSQLIQLQEVVNMIAKKEDPPLSLALPVAEGKGRALKKEISEVSLDSQGFPKCLASPEPLVKGSPASSSKSLAPLEDENETPLLKGDSAAAELPQPSFKRKRKGAFQEKSVPEEAPQKAKSLKEDLGIGGVFKRPAKKKKSKSKKARAGAGSTKPPLVKGTSASSSARKKWLKLSVTVTRKPPWRAYILGTTVAGEKPRLIVETTKHKHPKYQEILAALKQELESKNLTKEEALALRQEYYETW